MRQFLRAVFRVSFDATVSFVVFLFLTYNLTFFIFAMNQRISSYVTESGHFSLIEPRRAGSSHSLMALRVARSWSRERKELIT